MDNWAKPGQPDSWSSLVTTFSAHFSLWLTLTDAQTALANSNPSTADPAHEAANNELMSWIRLDALRSWMEKSRSGVYETKPRLYLHLQTKSKTWGSGQRVPAFNDSFITDTWNVTIVALYHITVTSFNEGNSLVHINNVHLTWERNIPIISPSKCSCKLHWRPITPLVLSPDYTTKQENGFIFGELKWHSSCCLWISS